MIGYEIDDVELHRENLGVTLDSFEKLWPVFKRHGFSRDTALIAFAVFVNTTAALFSGGDDGEDWKWQG